MTAQFKSLRRMPPADWMVASYLGHKPPPDDDPYGVQSGELAEPVESPLYE